jgi:hypothetical protein
LPDRLLTFSALPFTGFTSFGNTVCGMAMDAND